MISTLNALLNWRGRPTNKPGRPTSPTEPAPFPAGGGRPPTGASRNRYVCAVTSYRPAEGILAELVDGRAALVNPAGTELFTLNPVGSVVWGALDHAHDLEGLVEAVLAICEPVAREVVMADVQRFLDELVELGLIVTD